MDVGGRPVARRSSIERADAGFGRLGLRHAVGVERFDGHVVVLVAERPHRDRDQQVRAEDRASAALRSPAASDRLIRPRIIG